MLLLSASLLTACPLQIARFAEYISRITNSGLILYWEEKVWRRIRMLRNQILILPETCNRCPLQLEHYYGTLFLFGVLLVCSVAAFATEVLKKPGLRRVN